MKKYTAVLFGGFFVMSLIVPVSPSLALSVGIGFAFVLGNPMPSAGRRWTHWCLGTSIVAMGGGMRLRDVAQVGIQGVLLTAVMIVLVLGLGYAGSRRFRIDRTQTVLIAVGTAICGGSAIAAVAPVLNADETDISVSFGVVFVLNSVALWVFPPIGHWMGLDPIQFGTWCALAIHDTSSVLGATSHYRHGALAIGTAMKLTRALWIIPVSLGIAAIETSRRRKSPVAPPKFPKFILFFLLVIGLLAVFPSLRPIGYCASIGGRRLIAGTLFLVGGSLNRDTIRSIRPSAFAFGLGLWVAVAVISLGVVACF